MTFSCQKPWVKDPWHVHAILLMVFDHCQNSTSYFNYKHSSKTSGILKFKYKPVKLKSGQIIYRPLIPIGFETKTKIDVLGILDSGSDISIIPKELAEIFGVEYEKENMIFGIAREPVKAKESKVYIKFGRGNEIYSFEIPALVPTEKEDVPVIIGRAGFFNQFKITFSESERKIEFKKFESYKIKYQ